jgi:hypothetical protein
VQHRRGKNHKRRCKSLKEVPFSQKEADAATGLGVEEFLRATKSLEDQEGSEEKKVDGSAMELEVDVEAL